MNKNFQINFHFSKLILAILLWFITIIVFAHLTNTDSVSAQATPQPIVIDGAFTDWSDKTNLIDSSVDDQTNPKDADITELRAASNTSGIYLLMTWDDTSFKNSSKVGVTYRNPAGSYFRIYADANGKPTGSVPANGVQIATCNDSTCQSTTNITVPGLTFASGTTWNDPFKTSTDCDGSTPSCVNYDLAVEIYIPYSTTPGIGAGPTGSAQYSYMSYSSYPSAGAGSTKDPNGPPNTGISCIYINGVTRCYKSDPTAVTLTRFETSSSASSTLICVGLALIILTGLFLFKHR